MKVTTQIASILLTLDGGTFQKLNLKPIVASVLLHSYFQKFLARPVDYVAYGSCPTLSIEPIDLIILYPFPGEDPRKRSTTAEADLEYCFSSSPVLVCLLVFQLVERQNWATDIANFE